MSNVTQRNVCFITLSLLVSLLLILAYTPLGFINIPPVSITTMHIPVIIGSIMLGPVYGGILGFAFGMISLVKASTGAVGAVNILFSPFASGEPFYSIIMCLVPRILLGIIPACMNSLLGKLLKQHSITIAISAGIATLCHTCLVLGCLNIFFNALLLKQIFLTILSINGSLELLAAIVIVPAVAIPLEKTFTIHKQNVPNI